MATPSFSVTQVPRSPAVSGYAYDITYESDVDTPSQFVPGLNTVTLPGMEPEFTIQGIEVQVLTKQIGNNGQVPAACYGTYDEATIVKYTDTLMGHDPTQAVVDLYLSSGVSTVRLFVY